MNEDAQQAMRCNRRQRPSLNSSSPPPVHPLYRSIEKMKTILIFLLLFIQIPMAKAESTGIGISVKLDKDKIPRVTIVSSFEALNATNVTVLEAAKKIAALRVNGNSHWIGIIVDDDIRLAQYLPLLDAISKNSMFELFFVDGDPTEKNYVSNNIRRMIEQAGAEQPATRPESKTEGSGKPQPESEGRSR